MGEAYARAADAPSEMELSIHSLILDLGSAPTFVAATWPWLKIIRGGTPRTPYFCGVPGFSSMLIFTTVTFSPSSLDSSSSAGPIMRHGPHHSAQKSTTTGFLELRTSVWKEASETLRGEAMIRAFGLRGVCFVRESRKRGGLNQAAR